MDAKRIGMLVGRERSFPNALISEIHRRDSNASAEFANVDITRIDQAMPYSVVLDRISHEVTCYQPYLKFAAIRGAWVVNDPFWRIADDKFFNTALCAKLGVAVPRTALLPSKSYGPDTSAETLHNLAHPLSWQAMADSLGFPMYIKPHWGGGWRDVYRVESPEELMRVYDKTGTLTMIAQQAIHWTQYVRCIVIGRENVRPALWDPRLSHFDRYAKAAEQMEPLSPSLEARVIDQARAICRGLAYDMNTVEFAIADGVPYAIDMMNSAPDFDITSLGEEHFQWTVSQMASLLVELAHTARPEREVWGR